MAKGKKPSDAAKAIRSNIRANSQAAKAAVKDATKEARTAAKLARKKQRELLSRSTGMDIREFRHAVSTLKKAGIVSKRTDARQQEATNYMRKKVRDFFGVVTGTEQAVALPKESRAKYKESGAVKVQGRFALIPKEDKDQIARVRKGGLIEVTTPKGRPGPDGQRPAYMREVILPYKMTHMHIVAERLQNDPTLDGLKEPDELFGARIYGHNIDRGFGWMNAGELGAYILQHYKHLMSGSADTKSVKYFRLYKFWNRKSAMPEGPQSEKDYLTDFRRKKKGGENRRGKGGKTYEQMRNDKLALKKKQKRAKETDAERRLRLVKQKERQAKLRAQEGYKRKT